jgi:histidinol dehydrogenase
MKIVLKPLAKPEDVEKDVVLSRRGFYDTLKKVEEEVRDVIEAVKEKGDAAVREYTEKFDGCFLEELRVPERDIERAWEESPNDLKEAVAFAAQNIRSFHESQRLSSHFSERFPSLLGEIVCPLRRVAAYVPGGRFAYPSSCLMTVIPAQVAGVKEIALFTPPQKNGLVRRETLATAAFLGVKEVYRVGGVQAVAAACFGTESITPVEKIVGPGNIYVTAAKRHLQGIVGTDALAGPSEVVILADESAPAEWVALDLLAQAEHDPFSLSILLSPSEALLFAAKRHLERELENFPLERALPILLYQVETMEVACATANLLAPEHVEILTEKPLEFLGTVRGGAVFLGPYAPVALGDYGYGPNHVLPTGKGATFSSPLSVRDFYTFSSFVYPSPPDSTLRYETYATLAYYEGLFFHRRSLLARAGKKLFTDIEQEWGKA